MVNQMAREVEVFLFSVKEGYDGPVVRNILSAMDQNGNTTILEKLVQAIILSSPINTKERG